jgi:electron transport complex protein RnfD
MPNNSPFFLQQSSVRSVMLRVALALIPGIAAYVWFFGAAILVQLSLATITALLAEAGMLKLRGKPIWLFVSDGSVVVTAWLIALAFPPIGPWWLVVVATLFAVVLVKHLYGGLGQNPFNPAMGAFALMIVAFPQLMSQWPAPEFTDFSMQLNLIFGTRELDAVTMATPLDALRSMLHTGTESASAPSGSGMIAGHGWEWIATGYLLGGLWLVQQRIITWHIPVAFLATLALIAAIFTIVDADRFAGPLFHLFGGGAMLCAFFIATDPVSASSTPNGKLIYAAAIGVLTWVIRNFGAFPDGVAFAVLLLNICVPLIDMHTQPTVFGHKNKP